MWEIKKIGIILGMEVMYVGSNTLTKAAMAQGMTNNIYITYTHAISLLLLFPAAFLYHRYVIELIQLSVVTYVSFEVIGQLNSFACTTVPNTNTYGHSCSIFIYSTSKARSNPSEISCHIIDRLMNGFEQENTSSSYSTFYNFADLLSCNHQV